MEQVYVNIVIAAARYLLTALGLSIIYKTSRCLDFSQGSMYAIGAYLSYVLAQVIRLPLAIAIPLAALGTAVVGGFLEWLIYGKLRRYHGGPLGVLLASLGILVIVENVIVLIFGDLTYGLRPAAATPGWLVLGARITPNQATLISAAVALYIIYTIIIKKTRAGLTLVAVGNDTELASIVGISVSRVYLCAALLGSFFSGFAGGLISLEVDAQPSIGGDALLIGVLVTMAGGPGKALGAVIASIVFAFIDNISAAYGFYLWRQALAFGGLILFLLIYQKSAVHLVFGART